MNWRKTLVNAIVGCSLGLLFCCGGSKQLVRSENTEVKEEVNYIPYYLKVYEADSLYLTGNYERSFLILDSLFKKFKIIDTYICESSLYIKSAYQSQNDIDYEQYFKKLFTEFGYNSATLEYDSLLIQIANAKGINSEKIRKFETIYKSKINIDLLHEIQKMIEDDQLYRNNFNKQKMDSIDLINEDKIKDIFEKIGYPNYEICCSRYERHLDNKSNEIHSILMHTGDSIRDAYFAPKVLEFVKQGKALPEEYASLIDQIYVYRNGLQLYGSILGAKLINDTLTTEKLRKSIGLPSMKYVQMKFYIEVKNNPQFYKEFYKKRPGIFEDLLKENPTIFED